VVVGPRAPRGAFSSVTAASCHPEVAMGSGTIFGPMPLYRNTCALRGAAFPRSNQIWYTFEAGVGRSPRTMR